MTRRRYLQLDVFANHPGAGNPLAVVLDAEGLDDATMQAIARWTRLPETTFVFPASPSVAIHGATLQASDRPAQLSLAGRSSPQPMPIGHRLSAAPHPPASADADYRLRIFSPRREVPFAGHPSVGTAHAVLEAGLATPKDGLLVQDGIAGKLPLRVEGTGPRRTIAVRTPRAQIGEIASTTDPRLRDALQGLSLGALPPVLMNGGRRWWLVELADEAALRGAAPNWAAIGKLANDTESMGLCVFARSQDPVYYLAVRAWVGAPSQFEDAASGAANATLAAWLASQNALPGSSGHYRISQGREVGHDAIIELLVDGQGDVWSGGRVVTVVDGQIEW